MTNRHFVKRIRGYTRGVVIIIVALSFIVALGNLEQSPVEAANYVKCNSGFACDNITMYASCECDGYDGACNYACTGSLYAPTCWYEQTGPGQCNRSVLLFIYDACAGAPTDPNCCGVGYDPCELDPSPPADIYILCSSYCILCQ
jgi:hypothetical protein